MDYLTELKYVTVI